MAFTVALTTTHDDDKSALINRFLQAEMRASALLPPNTPLLRYHKTNSSPAAGIL